MAIADRKDPYRGFNFAVEIQKTAVAGFRECGGLSFTTDAVDYREGNEVHLHVRKLRGLSKFPPITMKRGFTDNKDLWEWYLAVLNGKNDRRNGAIVLRDEQQQPVIRWEFINAWICKWEGPAMNATTNDVAIESIEICVERIELK
jgi:phage tail-like protein